MQSFDHWVLQLSINCRCWDASIHFLIFYQRQDYKPSIDVWRPRLDQIRKSEREITKSYNSIGTNDSIARLVEDGEQQGKMLLAELRTAAAYTYVNNTYSGENQIHC